MPLKSLIQRVDRKIDAVTPNSMNLPHQLLIKDHSPPFRSNLRQVQLKPHLQRLQMEREISNPVMLRVDLEPFGLESHVSRTERFNFLGSRNDDVEVDSEGFSNISVEVPVALNRR